MRRTADLRLPHVTRGRNGRVRLEALMKKLYLLATVAIFALVVCPMASAAELSAENQARLGKSVDSYVPRMSEVALKIWNAPELGYQEGKTTALLQDELRQAGFTIEAGVAGIPHRV